MQILNTIPASGQSFCSRFLMMKQILCMARGSQAVRIACYTIGILWGINWLPFGQTYGLTSILLIWKQALKYFEERWLRVSNSDRIVSGLNRSLPQRSLIEDGASTRWEFPTTAAAMPRGRRLLGGTVLSRSGTSSDGIWLRCMSVRGIFLKGIKRFLGIYEFFL